ncbi:MAG: AMP-binding protein [Pseudomonadota bacterium]
MRLEPDHPPRGTVRDWLDHRAEVGGPAMVFPEDGSQLSWAELREAARRVAADLGRRGAAKGESIAVMHPNGRAAVVALYAALYGGYRATMINLSAGQDAIAYALDHCSARFAFVDEARCALFDQTRPDRLVRIAETTSTTPGPLHELSPEDHALLMYTSGTTGRPKGVLHSHASLLAGGWTAALAHALTPEDRGFCVLPIYHINGLCVTVMGVLVSGGSLAMCARFSASRFWDQIDQGQATWFSVVPTIISHLLHSEGAPGPGSALRFGRSASSALAAETQRMFESRFGVPIIETMGLTETAAQILSNPLPPGERKLGSPGRAYGNEVAILRPDLSLCLAEEEGEIAVRGPNVMLGYLRNPEATGAAFAGGWLRTGDIGRMDHDGYVFVTGRLKELIIKGGENIAPREIDEVLYSHPDVVEAAAFARKCESYGERVEAAVAVKTGSSVTAAALQELCASRLGSFKAPDVIHVLGELPKGPSGKIQRLRLAALTE